MKRIEKYELFNLIFEVLISEYENNPTEAKLQYLSEATPEIWVGTSGDPVIFKEFSDYLGNIEITLVNSYEIATSYINWLIKEMKKDDFYINPDELKLAFERETTKEKWNEFVVSFIATEHKGGPARDLTKEGN